MGVRAWRGALEGWVRAVGEGGNAVGDLHAHPHPHPIQVALTVKGPIPVLISVKAIALAQVRMSHP